MKFEMTNKGLLMVVFAAGLVGILPLFVVLAAQGQITEVNPSGVSGVTGTVSIDPDGPLPDGPLPPREVTITASTSWKVVGKKGVATGVVAKFDFTASDNEVEGSPVFTCTGVGASLSGLVAACQEKLTAAELDIGSGLGKIIADVKIGADAGLSAIGINEATWSPGAGIAGESGTP